MPRKKLTEDEKRERQEKKRADIEKNLYPALLAAVRTNWGDSEARAAELSARKSINAMRRALEMIPLLAPKKPNSLQGIVANYKRAPAPKKGTEEYYEWLRNKNRYLKAVKALNNSGNVAAAKRAEQRRKEAHQQKHLDKVRVRTYDLYDPYCLPYETKSDWVKRSKSGSISKFDRLLALGRLVRLGVNEEVPQSVLDAHDDGTLLERLRMPDGGYYHPSELLARK